MVLNFDVEGEIPEGGIEISVDTGVVYAAFEEFVPDEFGGRPRIITSGFASLLYDGDGSGFVGKMDENTATITLIVDSDRELEGSETFELSILDGEDYDVSSNSSVN